MKTAKLEDVGRPALSVVVPVCNERHSITSLLDEIVAVLRPVCRFEIICVDDGSDDGTAAAILAASATIREVAVIAHDRNRGQSVALLSGVQAAAAPWIVTLDGDGQNDPADIPRLLAERARQPEARLLAGRRAHRRDRWSKRAGSRFANYVRRGLLHDGTPDTGCGIKLFEREAFLALPRFNHMHRYLPALFLRDGWQVASVAVNHRAREFGRSKYGNLQRLRVGILDLMGVWWLSRRGVACHARRLTADTAVVQPEAGIRERAA